MNEHAFLSTARERYVRANKRSLEWLIDRPALLGGFLNSKLNSITLEDYGTDSFWRGPEVVYGWIQGRGLEALLLHAAFFEDEDPNFAKRLYGRAKELYAVLAPLFARYGHGYFSYDRNLVPIFPDGEAMPQSQVLDSNLYTYSDAFMLKGLIAASRRFEPHATANYLKAFQKLIVPIEQGRFILNEQQQLDFAILQTQPDDYAPRMIMLGGAAALKAMGFDDETRFGERFITHVLKKHVDETGVIRDIVGQDRFNVGHAIEFIGFACEYLGETMTAEKAKELERSLLIAFGLGFSGTGIPLAVSISRRTPLSEYMPWWSLAETIRAAALTYKRTRTPESLSVWQKADHAFFKYFWREDPPIAYQTRTQVGPADYVPATPDLDPAYHTGLSLLSAIRSIDLKNANQPS